MTTANKSQYQHTPTLNSDTGAEGPDVHQDILREDNIYVYANVDAQYIP
ncbi:hypothetical protein ACO22_08157 [Paracoccidioides brasiliensis]|uniref:Uncharacterized protein n=1 Tax=Paracoccidioides brasiliensis TaxID=121759 RepID=A0A1D2J310_PARBR|nr:hypothetical protein ACO22_08157 [Paracoccidioides brasiliensis]